MVARRRTAPRRRRLPASLWNGYGGSVDDDAIQALVTDLARAHPSGGSVIERAAIVASGGDADVVIAWIVARGGQPEAAPDTSVRRGLHGSRLHDSGGPTPRTASRFVLPAGALGR
jgi:hypothetical protein